MAERSSYRHGRILWAYLRSSISGRRERHPAVILDRDEDITPPERFDPRKEPGENIVHVIGISTKYRNYKLPYVPLPYAAGGHAVSRLREDCAAVIGWYHRIVIPDDVIGFGGEVPPAAMYQIDRAVRLDLVAKLGREFEAVRAMLDQLLDSGE